MSKILVIGLFLLSLFSCTKEVHIDIPGYEEQLVIDGFIETGQPPIVLLSRSNDIYSATNLQAYLDGFVSGATVTVDNGTSSVVLDEICTDALPAGSEPLAAQIFGIPVTELANYHLCAYTTFDLSVWGVVGKTYNLTVTFEGKTYTSSTRIEQPTPLVNSFWKEETSVPDYGYSWATLADPANSYDAYRWEVKYPSDAFYTKTFNPFFDDQFFDGLSFDFYYENPMTWNDQTLPSEIRGYYHLGDTVIIKLSKMDKAVFEFQEKKYTQMYTAGNPFATPTNIPTNIVGGALGLWAGYSPSYDTLICVP